MCFSVLGLKPKSVWSVTQCDRATAFLSEFLSLFAKSCFQSLCCLSPPSLQGLCMDYPPCSEHPYTYFPCAHPYSSGISLYHLCWKVYSDYAVYIRFYHKRNPCFYFFSLTFKQCLVICYLFIYIFFSHLNGKLHEGTLFTIFFLLCIPKLQYHVGSQSSYIIE